MEMIYALIALLFVVSSATALMIGQAFKALTDSGELRTQELQFVLNHMREQQEAAAKERQALLTEFTGQIDTLLQQAHAQREQLLTRIQDPQVAITQIPVGTGDKPSVEVYDELAELREEQPDLFDEDGKLKEVEPSIEYDEPIRPVGARKPFGAENGSES